MKTLVFPEISKFSNEVPTPEIVLTGLKNTMMPLIRYRTGDRGQLEERGDGYKLNNMTGRIHDLIPIAGVDYPTHYIQDLLDRIGGIEEFQVVLRTEKPILLMLVLESWANVDEIKLSVVAWWKGDVEIQVVGTEDLIRIGWRDKFRYVVNE
jgi:phenylacetate-CoA ligase